MIRSMTPSRLATRRQSFATTRRRTPHREHSSAGRKVSLTMPACPQVQEILRIIFGICSGSKTPSANARQGSLARCGDGQRGPLRRPHGRRNGWPLRPLRPANISGFRP
jgi:hypothetical protein